MTMIAAGAGTAAAGTAAAATAAEIAAAAAAAEIAAAAGTAAAAGGTAAAGAGAGAGAGGLMSFLAPTTTAAAVPAATGLGEMAGGLGGASKGLGAVTAMMGGGGGGPASPNTAQGLMDVLTKNVGNPPTEDMARSIAQTQAPIAGVDPAAGAPMLGQTQMLGQPAAPEQGLVNPYQDSNSKLMGQLAQQLKGVSFTSKHKKAPDAPFGMQPFQAQGLNPYEVRTAPSRENFGMGGRLERMRRRG